MGVRRRLGLLLAAAALVLAGCTPATVSGHPSADVAPRTSPASTPASSGSSAPPARVPPLACPAGYRTPDPNRPRMTLDLTLSRDHRTVDGQETVVFQPDLQIHQLVFRLTANTAPSVAEGNRIRIDSASADHGARHFTFTRANAAPSTQGGLLQIPFGRLLAPGSVITAHIRFTLTLGRNKFDRFGRAGPYAWFGSGEPLLAWQRGFGWHTEDMIDFPGESATSEAMDVHLVVHAPARDTVIMSGDPTDPPASSTGLRVWRSHIATARDVSVAAGPFAVADARVGSVRLRVGAPDPQLRDELLGEFERALRLLSARFGPYPFPSLSVARLPASGGGIEYPSSILMLNGSRLVAVHETAHQWFYAMVGDSQALHPWLDEAFATYAEQLVDHDDPVGIFLNRPGRVDSSTESYGHDAKRYYVTTYFKGAAALLAARDAAGSARFDAAVRCYARAYAWQIATPYDFERAITGLPAAVQVLRRAGAIP